MNRGNGSNHFFAVVALLVATMLFASGCGESETDTASEATGPTAAANVDAATEPTEEESAAEDGSKSDSSKPDSDSSKAEAPKSDKTPGQKAVDSEVATAFNRLMKAYRDRDYDYVCERAYSSDYVAELEKRGGCTTVVKQEIGSVKSSSGSFKNATRLSDTLVEANVVLRITPKSGATAENDTQVHFKKQAGEWKYFIYTGNNG